MKKAKISNRIPVGRPSQVSLQGRAGMNLPHNSGNNKSVWQSFVDAAGFSKRHNFKVKK